MLLAAISFVSIAAAYKGPVVAQFHWDLTPQFVQRVEDAVGYPVTEFVPPRGLLLFVTIALNETLHREFSHSLASVRPFGNHERCSPMVAAYEASPPEVPAPQATAVRARWLQGNATHGGLASQEREMVRLTSGTLRVTLHGGAVQGRAAAEIGAQPHLWHELLAGRLEGMNGTNATMNLVVEDDTHVVVHGVPFSHYHSVAMVLADVDCVCFVEPVLPAQPLNMWSASAVQAGGDAMPGDDLAAAVSCFDTPACSPLWAAGYRGQGQLVSVSDTGLNTDTCMFVDAQGRPVPQSSSFSVVPTDTGHRSVRAYWNGQGGDFVDANGHGTHVAGTAAGNPAAPGDSFSNGLRSELFAGVAPEARLVFVDLEGPGSGEFLSIPTPYDSALLQWTWNAGARIHSGSWGIADYAYSAEDRQVDAFCWNHRSFVAVFSAGNSGDTRGASSILSPALAKNALAVGATMQGFTAADLASGSSPPFGASAYESRWIADFSSRGGVAQGVPWMKPDLLAGGGQFTWSSSSDSLSGAQCSPLGDVVVGIDGTSMAAPVVAGAVAIVRQWFAELGPYEPMASLVKCVLSASGEETAGVFPSIPMGTVVGGGAQYGPYGRKNVEGHGRVALHRVLHTQGLGAPLVLSNEDQGALTFTNQEHEYCVVFAGGGNQLTDVSVALAWTDYPSSVASEAALVNDLDLQVTLRSAETGAIVREMVPPNGLTGRDGSSTLELVKLSALNADSVYLQVRVKAHRISFLEQTYSLLVSAHDGGTRRVTLRSSCEPEVPETPSPPAPIPPSTPVPTQGAQCPAEALCLQGSGVLVAGDDCNDYRCACLPGWADDGQGCGSCAASAMPSLVTPLCVGLSRNHVPAQYSAHSHARVSVRQETVAARLVGSFYEAGQNKPADVLPGTGNVDCWCLPSALSIPFHGHATQHAAAQAALRYIETRDALLALALPVQRAPPTAAPVSPTPRPTTVPPSQPPTPRPTTAPAPPAQSGATGMIVAAEVILFSMCTELALVV